MTISCPNCGAGADEGTKFCTSCGQPMGAVTERQNSSGWRSRTAPPATSGGGATGGGSTAASPSHAPDPSPIREASPSGDTGFSAADVILAHGEVVMREYPVIRMRRPLGRLDGHIVITDARVIYRAHAKNLLGESHAAREVQISKVTGAGVSTQRGISPMSAITAAGVWGLMSFLFLILILWSDEGSVSVTFTFFWLLFSAMILLGVLARIRNSFVMFNVFSSDTASSPVALTGYVGSSVSATGAIAATRGGAGLLMALGTPILAIASWLGIQEAADAANSANAEDTRAMFNEIGALILDIQSRGVLAGSDDH